MLKLDTAIIKAPQRYPDLIPWQDGEELHDLACSFEAMGDRALPLREYTGPPTVMPHREEHGL
jgi:hypothetical protein